MAEEALGGFAAGNPELVGGIAIVVLAVAIAWVLFVPAADWLAHHDVSSAKGPLLQTARDAARGRLLTFGAGLFAAGALVFTARNFNLLRRNSQQADQWQRRTHELTEQGQVTDRYTKAIEQLGSDKLDVRIGGIYALERVARDSARDHPTVIEVLTAFIREHSHEQTPPPDPAGPERERSMRPDIKAALTAVERRDAKRDTRPIDLADANLDRANLTGADLTGANLTRAILTGADLPFASLGEAKLGGADLTGANLIRADLADANLTGANLTRADLRRANLTYAFLTDADLTRADLDGADLTRANLNHANLNRANLSNANLTGAYLITADLTGATVQDADLTHANLGPEGYDFATLRDANLNGVILRNGWLRDANLTGAHLIDADLTGAHLDGADLTGANLGDAKLGGANLAGAKLTGANLASADLTGAKLTYGANLTGANLHGVNLTDADLDGADLTDAEWSRHAPVPEGWKLNTGFGRLERAGTDSGPTEAN